MFRIAALAVLLAGAMPAASLPKPKFAKLKSIRSVILADNRKGRMLRLGLGFAATTGTLAFRPGAGPYFPAAAPQGAIITAGSSHFDCSRCVGSDWSKGKP